MPGHRGSLACCGYSRPWVVIGWVIAKLRSFASPKSSVIYHAAWLFRLNVFVIVHVVKLIFGDAPIIANSAACVRPIPPDQLMLILWAAVG